MVSYRVNFDTYFTYFVLVTATFNLLTLLAGTFSLHLQHMSVTVTAFLRSSLILLMTLDMHFRIDSVRGSFTKRQR